MINRFDKEYSFLSNFYSSPIQDGYFNYPTVEHYYQTAKTLDLAVRGEITAADTPGQAKELGRKVLLREDWEDVKDTVMLEALRLKFSDLILREKLLATGDEELVEGNWWHDNYWGICYCEQCVNKAAKNRLGELLMQLREEIKSSM